jgi:hypothetical protein
MRSVTLLQMPLLELHELQELHALLILLLLQLRKALLKGVVSTEPAHTPLLLLVSVAVKWEIALCAHAVQKKRKG